MAQVSGDDNRILKCLRQALHLHALHPLEYGCLLCLERLAPTPAMAKANVICGLLCSWFHEARIVIDRSYIDDPCREKDFALRLSLAANFVFGITLLEP